MAVDLVAALAAWLTEEAGGGAIEGIRRLVRGDPQDQALRAVVARAIDDTVAWTDLGEADAKHLKAVLSERDQVPDGVRVRTAADLKMALAAWVAALDQPEFGGPGYLTALRISGQALAEELASRIEAGIGDNARADGALGALAAWLWRDDTTARLERIEARNQPDGESLARMLFMPAQHLQNRPPPSFLLRSGFEVVQFSGREKESEDFLKWAAGGEPVGVRLCFGPGGQGKTRFAQHLVSELIQRGWVAGRLRPHPEEDQLGRLLRLPAGVFVVMDYAEAQASLLRRIFDLLAEPRPDGAKLRLLLMARSAGEWWDEACGRAPDPVRALLYEATYELPPLFSQPSDRQAAFRAAVAGFCDKGSYVDDGLTLPADLDDDRYARALTLHMTALAAVLDHQHGRQGDETAARLDPAARVLEHERGYWADSARAVNLPYTQRRLLDAVMTAATCCGAVSRAEAIDLLGGLPDLGGEHRRVLGQYADWVHHLHPGYDWLNPLEPDLLGEYFIAQTLRNQDDLVPALARSALAPDQMRQMIEVIADAATQHQDMPKVIDQVFSAGSDELWLVGVALAAYLPDPRIFTQPLLARLATINDDDMLRFAAEEIPSTHRVSELKIATARRALNRYRSMPGRDPAAEAVLIDHLSAGLYYGDYHEEVVELQLQLIKIYSKLAKQDPRRYTADLGHAMLNYAKELTAPRTAGMALDLASKVVTMATALREEDRPDLLMKAFSVRSMALKDLNRPKDAVRAAERAVREARTAARTGEYARAWLPMEIMNLANRYSELRDHQQALETIQEAVDLMRDTEGSTPDLLSPNMPRLLFNYAQCLQDLGMKTEARQAIAEAAARLQRLATTSKLQFRMSLLQAIGAWLWYLEPCGADDEQVRVDYERVISILAELTENSPSAYGPSERTTQVRVISRFADKLIRAGDKEQGRRWKAEAARVRRELSDLLRQP